MNELSQEELIERLAQATIIISNKARRQMVALYYSIDVDMPQPKVMALQTGNDPWHPEWIKGKRIYEDAMVLSELLKLTIDDYIPSYLFEPIAMMFSTDYRKNDAKKSSSVPSELDDNHAIVQLWILRALMLLGGHRSFIKSHGFQDDALAKQLGLDSIEEDPFDQEKALNLLRQRHEEAEEAWLHQEVDERYPIMFNQSLQQLSLTLGLTEIECQLFAFSVFLYSDNNLAVAVHYLKELSADKLFRVLATLLAIDNSDVRNAFSEQGVLRRSELLKIDQSSAQMMRSKLMLISASTYDLMMDESFTPLQLLKDKIRPSADTQLTLADYPYFEQQIQVLQGYLSHVIASKQQGVNVLLYGESGTGKTELIRALAKVLSVSCFEVSNIDKDNEVITLSQRLKTYSAAQALLKGSSSVLMFDEVDALLTRDAYVTSNSISHLQKSWFTQLLEDNHTPTIWISNTIENMDSSLSQRFDLVFELPIPNAHQRENLLNRYDAGLLSTSAKHRFAQHPHLSPAIIVRACKLIKALSETQLNTQQRDNTFELIVNKTLQLQQHSPLLKAGDMVLPSHYHTRYLNTRENMAELAESLTRCHNARICLYGPPGTGKTAFGHFLAQALDKPLLIKKASDIFNKYVGETESSMAMAFAQARKTNSILMIDEIDSFIAKRDASHHSWEISSINEMLTQMESFSGIFVASTNRIDGLDQAALRRFDLKIKVDYLTDEQKQALFIDTCTLLSIDHDNVSIKDLYPLTPGDFAVVIRQHQFQAIKDVQALVSALQQEVNLKNDGKRIGF